MPRQLLFILCLILFLSGCTGTIIAPSDVTEARTVQLLEHGRHTSLLLTAADNSRVRYAYGDWKWYVDGDESFVSGARALLINSSAALGRQLIGPKQPGERLASAVGVGIGKVHALELEAVKVDQLIEKLEQQFKAEASEPFFSEKRNLSLVPHPQPYTFFHNSNHMVVEWLREMDVSVRGNPATGNWLVEPPVNDGN